MKMAPDIMLLRMKIRINIVRCIDVNKIEITVLSARVLDALSVRGLKAKWLLIRLCTVQLFILTAVLSIQAIYTAEQSHSMVSGRA